MPIVIKNLTHIYNANLPLATEALHDINLTVEDGEYIGLIGHTGSGKSTLIQHLNGLLKPTSGQIIVNGFDLADKKTSLRAIRKEVGLVFQYPEYQLFEETIAKDIAFGPKNLGLDEAEVSARVEEAMQLVGLEAALAERSPFELSGGQRRRVAIAGVLSMRPKVLILDEPIAGLDPKGRAEILQLIDNYHKKYNATIILVSHNMDDIANVASRIIVMNRGRVALDGTPKQIFSQTEKMQELGLDVPQVALLARELSSMGVQVPKDILTQEEMLAFLLERRNKKC